MHRFTDKDIEALKTELWGIIYNIRRNVFDFTPYIKSNLLTHAECDSIRQSIKTDYPAIEFTPLPKHLQPLIKVAKDMLMKSRVTPPAPPPRKSPSYYTWEDDFDYYYRPRDEFEYY